MFVKKNINEEFKTLFTKHNSNTQQHFQQSESDRVSFAACVSQNLDLEGENTVTLPARVLYWNIIKS